MGTQRIRCSEVWGGVRNIDVDIDTPGLAISIYSHAADGNSGGDLHYFSVCGKDMLTRIVIADLMGHGEAVSELSQWLYKAVAVRMNSLDGGSILSDLNQVIRYRGIEAMTTAAVIAFYLGDSHLYYSNAGHPPSLIRRRGENSWHPLDPKFMEPGTNMPLGIFSDAVYDQDRMPLLPGDRLALYTDGVTDGRDKNDEPFGTERLASALNENDGCDLRQVKNAILDSVRCHTGGTLDHDDLTLMLIEVSAQNPESVTPS